jgi:hypothetical protein
MYTLRRHTTYSCSLLLVHPSWAAEKGASGGTTFSATLSAYFGDGDQLIRRIASTCTA